MSNLYNIKDIVNSIKTIEKDCEIERIKESASGNWEHQKNTEIDHKKFYERMKGLMILLEENLENNKRRGIWR
jgi:hypothetical protein